MTFRHAETSWLPVLRGFRLWWLRRLEEVIHSVSEIEKIHFNADKAQQSRQGIIQGGRRDRQLFYCDSKTDGSLQRPVRGDGTCLMNRFGPEGLVEALLVGRKHHSLTGLGIKVSAIFTTGTKASVSKTTACATTLDTDLVWVILIFCACYTGRARPDWSTSSRTCSLTLQTTVLRAVLELTKYTYLLSLEGGSTSFMDWGFWALVHRIYVAGFRISTKC